jgi:hypothetical protein
MVLLLPHQSSSYFGMPSKVVSEGLGRREDIVAFPATKVRIQRHLRVLVAPTGRVSAHLVLLNSQQTTRNGSEIYTGELTPRARMASQQLCKHSFLRVWGVPLPRGDASVSCQARQPLVQRATRVECQSACGWRSCWRCCLGCPWLRSVGGGRTFSLVVDAVLAILSPAIFKLVFLSSFLLFVNFLHEYM